MKENGGGEKGIRMRNEEGRRRQRDTRREEGKMVGREGY